jgi:hypothetical protein
MATGNLNQYRIPVQLHYNMFETKTDGTKG